MAWPNRPGRQRHRQQRGHAHRAGRLTGDGYPPRVTAERGDVVLYPPQRSELVEQAEVGDAVAEEQEALRGQPVVDGHADHAVPGERRAVVRADRSRSVHERAAVDPDEHGQPARAGVGRPHVEVQAVLARDHFLGEQRLVLRRVVTLGHGRSECGRVSLARPGRDGLGREHAVRAERRCRVGDAEEGGHPRFGPPPDRPVSEPDHRMLHRTLDRLAHASLHCHVRVGLSNYLALVDLRWHYRVHVSPWD